MTTQMTYNPIVVYSYYAGDTAGAAAVVEVRYSDGTTERTTDDLRMKQIADVLKEQQKGFTLS